MECKLQFVIFLLSICFLTACPAPEFNHIIINESKTILDVEYEYAASTLREDHSKLATPAKINLQQYGDGGYDTQWINLTAENEFQTETAIEESASEPNADRQRTPAITKVRLKLLPGEVLRVFVSNHINMDSKRLKSISLRGEKGKFEIEGEGFEQFYDHRPDRFFTDTKDYRIVCR